MPKITIYTTTTCPFCRRALELLLLKKVKFNNIDVTAKPDIRQQMSKLAAGRTSVPQIFINDQHIGGCDDLYALDKTGQLDPLLKD